MVNYALTSKTPLDGYQCNQDGVTLREMVDFSTFSISHFKNYKDKLNAMILSKLGVVLPEPGLASSKDGLLILSVAREQWFIRFSQKNVTQKDMKIIQDALNNMADLAAITDQSDSWVELEMSGPNASNKLACLCSVDLHKDIFKVNNVARTSIEHLAVIITRLKNDGNGNSRFLTLSPRSSARSFLEIFN